MKFECSDVMFHRMSRIFIRVNHLCSCPKSCCPLLLSYSHEGCVVNCFWGQLERTPTTSYDSCHLLADLLHSYRFMSLAEWHPLYYFMKAKLKTLFCLQWKREHRRKRLISTQPSEKFRLVLEASLIFPFLQSEFVFFFFFSNFFLWSMLATFFILLTEKNDFSQSQQGREWQ